MWVMTSFGILMPSLRPPKTVPLGDNRTLQVRTRREQDLDILRDEYMGDQLGPTIATPDFDYNYRAYCTPEAFGQAVYQLSLDINFEKFKPTTMRYGDSELHGVYNRIWTTVCQLNDPWGAKDWEKSASAQRGDVLRDPHPVYTPLAGPPKEAEKLVGYAWDKHPPVSIVQDVEALEADERTQSANEFFDEVLSVSQAEWAVHLSVEERTKLAAELLASD